MTVSIRELVLAAAAAALKTMSSIAGASVYRSRHEAFAKEEFPCVVLEPLNDNPALANSQKSNWDFIFVVHVGVKAKMAEIPDQLADPIMLEAHAKVMGDATLDALLINREPGPVAWQINEADATLCWTAQQFKVSYRTNLADITA